MLSIQPYLNFLEQCVLTISVRTNDGILHYLINEDSRGFYIEDLHAPTVGDLIQHYIKTKEVSAIPALV